MGGNALKHYETKRLDSAEYFFFTGNFRAKFYDIFGFYPVLITAYKNKKSFGDADFLVQSDLLPPDWTDKLKTAFDLQDTQYIKNGNVVSIGVDNFQVDLIVTANQDMNSSEFYFSYNDFGNLIGRIGHKLGIKIGHKGASIVVRHRARSDHILKEIFLTKNITITLDILGLNVMRYYEGFDKLEDIFEYVASSKYFDPEIYSLEHRSNTSRVRDKKRETYNKFLRWVAETKPEVKHSFGDKSELGSYSLRMPYYETEVLTRFPLVKQEVEELISEFELDLKFKEVYNGNIVSEMTGYTNKTLGAFMSKMREKLDKHTKQFWIDNPRALRLSILQLWVDVGGIQFKVD